jgi:epoxyqueuosine reductase
LDAYIDWLDRGLHAGMAYMKSSRSLRTDPGTLLHDAKSILAVSLNYNQEVDKSVPRVARYALGRDYHKVLRGKLKRVARRAEALHPGLRARPSVDSAPILERDFAYQAGIGWFGKNTMLIDSKRGSWFFIGLLLLSDHFQADDPAQGGCGKCRACIEACPTGALVLEKDRPVAVMHSERCISYRTIEHRGDLPGETHGWLLGCDICQEVCPFNQPRSSAPLRASLSSERDFRPRDANQSPNLAKIALLDREAFVQMYGGTAFMRAGVDRLKRNALAVLQPNGEPER